MAYDAARDQTVLFGGFNGAHMNDTWLYDASGWVRVTTPTLPPARSEHAMAYDPLRQRVVMLGGSDGSGLSDIWEWDGSDWTMAATSVPGLGGDGMACFDPRQGQVFYNQGSLNFVWNGVTATPLTIGGPTTGSGLDMAYDPIGGTPITVLGQQTYRFSEPGGWQRITFSNLFSLQRYAMAVDPVNHYVVFQGGGGTVGSGSGRARFETWLWTGQEWGPIAGGTLPAGGRERHAMVFDVAREVFVTFGGLKNNNNLTDETWELQSTTQAASYREFGPGCAGSTGTVPRLTPERTLNSAPLSGGTFTVRIEGVPPGQLLFAILGGSNATYQGQALPLPLDGLGMPGCALLASAEDVSWLTSGPTGTTLWTLAVPVASGYVGSNFFQQVASVAPGANAAGLIWTNAGEGVIGFR